MATFQIGVRPPTIPPPVAPLLDDLAHFFKSCELPPVSTFKKFAIADGQYLTWLEFRGLLESHGYDTSADEAQLRRAFQASSGSKCGLSKCDFVKLLTTDPKPRTLPGRGNPDPTISGVRNRLLRRCRILPGFCTTEPGSGDSKGVYQALHKYCAHADVNFVTLYLPCLRDRMTTGRLLSWTKVRSDLCEGETVLLAHQ
jgi:hypothetical protein